MGFCRPGNEAFCFWSGGREKTSDWSLRWLGSGTLMCGTLSCCLWTRTPPQATLTVRTHAIFFESRYFLKKLSFWTLMFSKYSLARGSRFWGRCWASSCQNNKTLTGLSTKNCRICWGRNYLKKQKKHDFSTQLDTRSSNPRSCLDQHFANLTKIDKIILHCYPRTGLYCTRSMLGSVPGGLCPPPSLLQSSSRGRSICVYDLLASRHLNRC